MLNVYSLGMSITGAMETNTRNQHQFLHKRYGLIKTYIIHDCANCSEFLAKP